ncbi:cytochrome P450 4C1-like [Lycorma delicatula]|uniref:cytochrome P450 4C1-like n=1 Tax=Lycorma delicatula TaxID=130591 RepID=UPI003F50D6B3
MILEILLSILLIFICIIIDFHEWPSLRTQRMIKKIRGPPEVLFFGHSPSIAVVKFEDMLNFFGRLCKEYGPVFKLWSLGIPLIILNEPEDIETLLSSVQYIRKGVDYDAFLDWLNEGLLVSTGAKWQYRRKLLTPAFHFRILEHCVPVFNRSGSLLSIELLKHEGKVIEVEPFVSKCTLDIICEAAMGFSLSNLPDRGEKYTKATKKMNNLVIRRILSPWLSREWFFRLSPTGREQARTLKILHSFTDLVIKERQEAFRKRKEAKEDINDEKEEKNHPRSFLDCLLELSDKDPGSLTQQGIREEVDTFMFEGHDTTSAAITAALFLLGHHTDIQERVFEELDDIFGNSDRVATMDDLHNLNYLERVVKETLRMYPSVPTMTRRLQSDLYLPHRKCVIPATANVIMFPYWLHRHHKYFPEPEVFNPDRFLPDEIIKRHPFAYLPFSGGPRNCIGQKFAMMEMKIILSCILRKIKVESITEIKEVKLIPAVILRPQTPFRLKIIRRS